MGHIKEPIRINLIVDTTPLTETERQSISEIIAFYKKTGKKKNVSKTKEKRSANLIRNKMELN